MYGGNLVFFLFSIIYYERFWETLDGKTLLKKLLFRVGKKAKLNKTWFDSWNQLYISLSLKKHSNVLDKQKLKLRRTVATLWNNLPKIPGTTIKSQLLTIFEKANQAKFDKLIFNCPTPT